ncbi:MAG: diguanylate cyclase [Candidatus Kapabacteria bacterium]|nr:diguanylate cyclase [Candidatus Kapabacteria bacterium]
MSARTGSVLEWTRYLTPTDAVYILSIVVGLFVAVFLEEVPIRLIGACVVLLSGVFLVINVQSRMREKIAWSRPSVSAPVELTKRVRSSDDGTTRIVFDDFASTFSEEHQESSPLPPPLKRNGTSQPRVHTEHGYAKSYTKTGSSRQGNLDSPLQEQGDETSSFRVVRRAHQEQEAPVGKGGDHLQKETNGNVGEQTEEQIHPRIRPIPLSISSLVDVAFEDDAQEPRREFAHIIKGIMQVLRSVMNARTATFFWYNPDRGELVLDAVVSDISDSIRNQRKFPLGDDILSHIVRSGQAQIVCDIQQSAECDLLPYYFQATGTRSFAAVPVYLHKTVVAVLAVDSDQNDAYDEQTVGTLGQCSRLISMLIQSYTAKYDLQQNARTLETIVHFRRLLQQSDCSIQDIAQALVNAATTLVEARGAGVVLFDPAAMQWTLAAVVGQSMPPVGTPIETEGTVIASTLQEGKIAHCFHCQGLQKRYATQEVSSDDGYFVAVPLRTPTDNYGALFVESTSSRISQQDIAALEIIGEHAGVLIAQLLLNEQVQHQSMMDQHTETYNAAAFRQRLAEEIERAHDSGQPLAVAIVQLDRYKALEQQQHTYEYFLEQVVRTIRPLMKPYHVVGRLEGSMLGILLPGLALPSAHLMIEKLRRTIAGTPHTVGGRSVVLTISAGVVEIGDADTADSAIEHASVALQQALRRTNTVVLYS